jgi:hypothetical protein
MQDIETNSDKDIFVKYILEAGHGCFKIGQKYCLV